MNAAVLGLVAFASAAAVADESLMLVRLRVAHTVDDVQWAKTFKALTENRGACDEVWFTTGVAFPSMDWHEAHAARLARYAEQLRGAGIVPSLQIQATLGHSDEMTLTRDARYGVGAEGKTWSGFTGPGGVECRACSCPRQPELLAYVREMAMLYAVFKPAWVWIDDDLRIDNHAPAIGFDDIGCWCQTCLAAFNAETGGEWTREALAAAIKKNSTLYDAWERFSFAGIAEVARVIASAMHEVSPETRFGYQHCHWRNDAPLAIFKAMHEVTGLPVGSRPGGGSYYDHNPNPLIVKSIGEARQMKMLGAPDWIGTWCPEVETYPRAFASRTAQGILLESIASLAYGMNAVSLNIMDPCMETDDWYSENMLAPLAAERPVLEGYRDWNRDTVPAGLADETGASTELLYQYSLTGVPVVPGVGKTFGSIVAKDMKLEDPGYPILGSGLLPNLSTKVISDIRRRADERSGGRLPVLVRDPSVALVVPRVTKDGRLKSVMMLNARIDVQKPVTLALRGVPADVTTATWRAFRNPPVALPLRREGGETLVTLPEISAWNAGWLAL